MKHLIALLLAFATIPANARTPVPDIAQICGVRVGYDTIEALERQIGQGLPQIGGHAHGARLWQSTAAECEVLADAFYYNGRGGRILDFISITPLSHDPGIPVAKLPRQQTLFMGVVSLGMTKAEVLRALKQNLPPPKAQETSLVWEGAGFVRHNRLNDVVTKLWRAELRFERDKLREIRLTSDTADYNSR